ncbi:MAG: hypothetical protein PHT99_04080, partial [Methanoregula sp.]|nr:hypothetical protein [Methanoregula sp.]
SRPVQDAASTEWDPWSDGDPEYDARPPALQETSRQSFPADNPVHRVPQIGMPQKKYSYLPLVADEMKGMKPPYTGQDEFPGSMEKERPAKKKGVLGFMKR